MSCSTHVYNSPIGRRRIALHLGVAALALALLLSGSVAGCNWAGKRVAEFIEPIRAQVDEIIASATAAGDEMLITAGGQVGLAVDNTISAFGNLLRSSVDSLDDTAKHALGDLKDLADNLASDSEVLIHSTIDGAQQLINTLPFANRNPQVREFTPHFTVTGASGTVEVGVSGNFVYASGRETSVSLKVGDVTYEAEGVTTSELKFLVPSSAFSTTADTIGHVQLELTVPYEKGRIFKSIEPGQFSLVVSVLPRSPLHTLTVTSTRQVTGVISETRVVPAGAPDNGGWRVQSWESCEDQNDRHVVSATPGWVIVPSQIQVQYISRGVASRGWAEITDQAATGFVALGHSRENCWGWPEWSYDSGDIRYYVTYSEEREVQTPETTTLDLLAERRLGWGESIVVPVARNSWALVAELWDGAHLELNTSDSSNPYLEVTDEGDTIRIEVRSPSVLR